MRYVLALTGMVVLFAFTAGGAFAGEVTGNGQYINGSDAAPLHGNSPCAYSGLNDNYVFENLPTDANGNLLPDENGFIHTQNWGHVVTQMGGNAGGGGAGPNGCNPHVGGGA